MISDCFFVRSSIHNIYVVYEIECQVERISFVQGVLIIAFFTVWCYAQSLGIYKILDGWKLAKWVVPKAC